MIPHYFITFKFEVQAFSTPFFSPITINSNIPSVVNSLHFECGVNGYIYIAIIPFP